MAEIEPAQRGAALKTAELLVQCLTESSRALALAESCTAGLAADLLASIPGASKALWGSFVCYTAEAKVAMLGLDRGRLEKHGLVSGETARDMAAAALEKSGASVAAAITGLAGPLGDGSAVPVGTVWIAVAVPGTPPHAEVYRFEGSRAEIRFQAARAALEKILAVLNSV